MKLQIAKWKYAIISRRRVVKCYCWLFKPKVIPARYRIVFLDSEAGADIVLNSEDDAASILRYAMNMYAMEKNFTEVNADAVNALTDYPANKDTCLVLLSLLLEQNPVANAPFIWALMSKTGIPDSNAAAYAFKYAYGITNSKIRKNVIADGYYTEYKLKQLEALGQ